MFSIFVFFTNLVLMKFQVTHLVLIRLFSVIDGFERFWMGNKDISLILELLKVPFLVLHFLCYTLMIFLMFSAILLSILMILFSTLSEISHLIYVATTRNGC